MIGNPPYNRGIDLSFVKLGTELSEHYTSMIIPAKWQTSEDNQVTAGKVGYGQFRKEVVPHMSKVVFFPCCKDVFDILQVDGVSYFIADKDTHDTCEVVNKSLHIPAFNSRNIRDIRDRQSLHNIGNEVVESLGRYQSYKFDKYYRGRYGAYINGHMAGGGLSTLTSPRKTLFIGEVKVIDHLNKLHMISIPDDASCVFSSNDLAEVYSFESWINTKLVRFLFAINTSKLNNILTDDAFRFVPEPPNGAFDHIYSDDELYRFYSISQEHIDAIESIVKGRPPILERYYEEYKDNN